MIFYNPSGAPELACNDCGCRWFDRMTNSCYECGAEVAEEDVVEYQAELRDFKVKKDISTDQNKSQS